MHISLFHHYIPILIKIFGKINFFKTLLLIKLLINGLNQGMTKSVQIIVSGLEHADDIVFFVDSCDEMQIMLNNVPTTATRIERQL